ncbi:MAG: hypothetical protein IPH84_17165 [Bacteroidales bacterium]|nr:hypothetical protein [Bacteroidales bacterium]
MYSYSVINYTHDSGASWHGLEQINSGWLDAAYLLIPQMLLQLDRMELFLHTSNAGMQWNKQVSTSTYDLLSYTFPHLGN